MGMNGWVRGTYDDIGETTEEVFALLVCPDKIAYIVDCSVVLCARWLMELTANQDAYHGVGLGCMRREKTEEEGEIVCDLIISTPPRSSSSAF